jgi:hypothetical protein
MSLSLGYLLTLRSEFESIVSEYVLDDDRKQGTIENLTWFINNGAVGNRFRPGFDRAYEISMEILQNK